MANDGFQADGNCARIVRRRAEHKNSHTGCLTCKLRRIKCDEEKPVCRRCQAAHKECKVDPRHAKKIWHVVSISTAGTISPQPSGVETYAKSCLQHFCTISLPAFHSCEPSPLWDYIRRELDHSKSLRCMAIALGHEALRAANPTAHVAQEAATFCIEAIQSLRQAIASAEANEAPIFNTVFHCLLLVILQCFRKSFEELNIHLQHGLRIASQAITDTSVDTVTVLLKESFRLLKQYSISVALFNPLLPQDTICNGMPIVTANTALRDPDSLRTTPSFSDLMTDDQMLRDEEQNLLLSIISATVTHRKPVMNHRYEGSLTFAETLEPDDVLFKTVQSLRARLSTLELAYQKRADSGRALHLEVSEARCMLIGLYLRCRWSGYACNYDTEFETFRKIVDKIQHSLERESAPMFSIDLGTVAPLFYTVIMCRHREIRHRAVALLSKCPQQDGPWNTALVTSICRALVRSEERKAQEEGVGYALTNYIPEHCRVAYYYYHASEDAIGVPRREHLRVYRRRVGTTDEYTYEDVDLDES